MSDEKKPDEAEAPELDEVWIQYLPSGTIAKVGTAGLKEFEKGSYRKIPDPRPE